MRAYYSLSSRPVRLEDDDVDEDALSAAFLLLPSLPMLHSLLLLCLSTTFRLVFPRRAPSRLTSPMNDCSCCWWWWCCWWSFTATTNTASSQNSLSTDDRRQRPLRGPSEDWLGHLIMWLQIALLLVCTAAVAFHFCPFSAGGNLACCTPLQPPMSGCVVLSMSLCLFFHVQAHRLTYSVSFVLVTSNLGSQLSFTWMESSAEPHAAWRLLSGRAVVVVVGSPHACTFAFAHWPVLR